MTAPAKQPRLYIVPCDMDAAKEFVARLHRHHSPPLGGKFALAVAGDAGNVHGVAIVGRPVSRMLDDGHTLEVTRVATDGCANACSALYGAARRAAWALGFRRVFTYTLPTESGASLRAAGFARCAERAGGGEWTRASRPRRAAEQAAPKVRWVAERSAPDEPTVALLNRDSADTEEPRLL